MSRPTPEPGRWEHGPLPVNVQVGDGSLITNENAFRRFFSECDPALVIGKNCTMEVVHFAIGKEGRIRIGDFCYFSDTVLLCEEELIIGDYVVMNWNVTIADTDFHPIAPEDRIADAIACSTLGAGRPRPPIARKPVVIENDVWIGPGATILKGVRIGAGAFIEPGAMVTRDVPPRARVMGNPAQVVEMIGWQVGEEGDK
jgi:acetyltransferase-like isoleucine patch superfamily enzyme